MAAILFLLIPLSSIGLLLLKDSKRERKIVMNVLLILNAVLFLSPMLMAYSNTPTGESMWNENTGGGAALWLYLIIFPFSAIAQIVLLVLKIIFAQNSK
jgi:hypothetical protein